MEEPDFHIGILESSDLDSHFIIDFVITTIDSEDILLMQDKSPNP